MPMGNILIEGIILAVAVVGIFEGFRLSRVALLFADPLGPGRYLLFTACLLLICTSAVAARQWRRRSSVSPGGDHVAFYKNPVGRAMLLLVLYATAAPLLGYLASSFLFFLLVQRVFGERSWIRCTVIAATIAGVFYFGFSHLAGVPLP